VVSAYQKREKDFYAGVAPRTIRGWQTLFLDAEARYGCGYVGLLPKTKGRGNRSAKASNQALALLEEAITSVYARSKHQRIRDVYPLYEQACQQQGIKPVCERTFYRKVKAHTGTELTEKRKGTRAAYQESSCVIVFGPSGVGKHLLSIRRRATSVSTHARLSSRKAQARRLIFPRQESGRGFEQDPRSFFLALPIE
jgi:hypothetical protein